MINSFQQQIQAKTQTKAEIQTQVYCFLLVCRTQTENELMMSAELPTGGHFALIHLTYHQTHYNIIETSSLDHQYPHTIIVIPSQTHYAI